MNAGVITVTMNVDLTAFQAAEKSIRKFEETTIASWNRVAQRTRTFGYLASTAISLPIILIGKSAFNMAKDFEYSIQKIVGLAGVAQNAVNSWEQDILKMAPRVAKMPKELAEALYFIASSGIKGAEALDVLELSAKAATAGLGETKDVADLLTSVLNAYKGTGLTASKATDILVAAVREGKGEAEDFAKSMGKVIPVSAQLGVSFDQVAGAMAAMTLAGASAANASTYLLGFLNILLKAPPAGDRVLRNLKGMSTSYAELRKELRDKGLLPTMEHIRIITEKYGDAIASDVLPNVRGLIAQFSVAGKNMAYNSLIMSKITESTGSLALAFDAVASTIKVRYDSALATGQVALIALGKEIAETFLPILNVMVHKLEDLTKWFSGLTDVQKHNRLVLAMWIAALGPIALISSAVIYSITGIISVFKTLGTVLTWLAGVFQTFKVVLATNPVGVLIFGIAALTAGYFALKNRINDARAAQQGFGEDYEKSPLKKYFETLETANSTRVALQENMMVLFAMNQKQLENQQVGIEQRLAALGEARIRLDVFEKTWMDKDEEFINHNKKLAFAEKQAADWGQYHTAKGEEQKRVWTQTADEERKRLAEIIFLNNRWLVAQKKMLADETKIEQGRQKIVDPILENIRKNKERINKAIETAKIDDETITKSFTDLAEGEEYLIRMQNLLGDSFDVNKEKFELYGRIIEELAHTKIPLTDQRVQDLVRSYKAAEEQVSKTTSIMESFKAAIVAIDMKKLIMGPMFDENTLKLEAAQKALDAYLEALAKKSVQTGGVFNPNLPELEDIKTLINLTKEYQSLIDQEEEATQLHFLTAQAEAFGSIDGQIEILNYELQRSTRLMEKIAKTKPFDQAAFSAAAKDAMAFQEALDNAVNTKQLTFLTDLANAFEDAGHYSDLISGKIDILQRKMEILSSRGEGGSEVFKEYAKQIERLSFQQGIVENLTNAFVDFFSITKEGFQNFDQYIKDWVRSVLQSFQKLIAELIAKKLVSILLKIFSAGAMGGSGIGNLVPMSPILGGGVLAAKGGKVPPGFPHDTYPALLSSGENIVPYGNMNKNLIEFEPVEFRIEENTLVGFLKKAKTRKSIY